MIILSNRLPYQLTEKNKRMILAQSSGGLVSSMSSYFQKQKQFGSDAQLKKTQWVGTADIQPSKFNILLEQQTKDENFDLVPVYLPESIKNNFYNGFCNDTIWPLFHYFPSYARFNNDYYSAYIQANKLFCDKLCEIYQPGDVIWIHDYHLMLLPNMIREILPNATIGFFLHIPFPSFELFRIIPNSWKQEVLKGLLGADLIGFHTNDYMQHFLKSVQQILGYDIFLRNIMLTERTVTVDSIPISIDYEKFHSAPNLPEVYNEKNSIKKTVGGKQIIVSVDRLDYAKALTNRLEAFELFLKDHNDYWGKVTYILVVVPSRDIITKYKENKREIERLVSNINGTYGNIGWTPIVYQYRFVDFNQLTALYFAADVALITPLRDGMNLVAKEFISTRIDKKGVLILSETAGASSELAEAVLVNPTDRQQISEAIYRALTMPTDEQIMRNTAMQERIKTYNIVKWVEDFLSQLRLQIKTRENLKIKEITDPLEAEILKRYRHAKKRLLLLDYDGTLTPIVSLPEQAKPSIEIIDLLRDLDRDENNHVVLISGRTKQVLSDWFSPLNIRMVAEHGAFYRNKNAVWEKQSNTQVNWKDSVRSLFSFYKSRCYGAFTEEKEMALAWHYRNAEKEMGLIRSRELLNELRELSNDLNFQVLEGKKVVEVKATGINKGVMVKALVEKDDYDFILAIGDDRTDEDMFKVLRSNGITIRVGLSQSYAKYNIRQQRGVNAFLKRMHTFATTAALQDL